uniref:GOLD domain-containing protein n=1 Tax=Romanomermis culicivorax TaxID=13658 RepID=A0A915JD75_ROMCU
MDFILLEYIIFTLLLYWGSIANADSLRFYLQPSVPRCIKQEIHKGVVVTGEYELSDVPGSKASVKVVDTRGHTLHNREEFVDTHGKFAFTADEYDMFEICITTKSPPGTVNRPREVHLTTKHGIEAKNYEQLAKAEKLKPLEVELRRLEDLSESIVHDFQYMRKREEEMRDTNESTNSRVLYLSIFSMCCLLGLALWQVLYLRRYFKAKKLID